MEFTSVIKDQYKNGGNNKNMAIVIDGIIGAGKSTVGKFLSESLDLPIFEELKSDGKDSLAQRMLDLFYEEPSRWSAIIQVMFLNDRFKDIKRIEAMGNRAILDRSIYGDEIFAKTIHDRGQMTNDEYMIYKNVLHNMLEHIKVPEVLIYIDVSVDTALHRINFRGRSTEGDLIPRDYLVDLQKNYEAWFEAFDLCPKIRLDLNESVLGDDGIVKEEVRVNLLKALEPYLKRGI
ncbi:deoxynucleoside kinase [Fusibacter ferrireducens]|uniref:Deoxynucleoside kinase n=1 Tax=Fusibacter ferrireducens TaxID=2785058 RepID=A0ABR9ZSY8_9FIRM|nr:deoxynucleoside kinase [Fusibacter ferrireducens]MBF4693560.1 deoxynucleoside kinase [Fusibacter ferrireducens]